MQVPALHPRQGLDRAIHVLQWNIALFFDQLPINCRIKSQSNLYASADTGRAERKER
jgi:hypothetical protein